MSKFRLNIVMEIINNLWINSYLRWPAMVNKVCDLILSYSSVSFCLVLNNHTY
jgi:hypothetical protein